MNKQLTAITILMILTGCTNNEIKIETLKNKSAQEIYFIGQQYAAKNKYMDAALAFEQVEKLHPYSHLVGDSLVLAGESFYKVKKYDEAISALESFIQIHTTHEKIPDALYILGLIYFDQIPIIQRDQDNAFRSLEYFEELCKRYPSSKYVNDANDKIKIIVQQLANQEFRTGRYYQKHKNFPAAISRFNTVIDTYPKTETAQEAYFRLIECYIATGFINEAKAIYKILKSIYKDSKWTKYATALLNNHKLGK